MEYCEKEPSQKHIARRSLVGLSFTASGSWQESRASKRGWMNS